MKHILVTAGILMILFFSGYFAIIQWYPYQSGACSNYYRLVNSGPQGVVDEEPGNQFIVNIQNGWNGSITLS